jgi:hypothetical protein
MSVFCCYCVYLPQVLLQHNWVTLAGEQEWMPGGNSGAKTTKFTMGGVICHKFHLYRIPTSRESIKIRRAADVPAAYLLYSTNAMVSNSER